MSDCNNCGDKTIVVLPEPLVVTGTGAAVVTGTAAGYNVHVPPVPAPIVDINVSNLTLDAAGNLQLTETDGSTHQVNIPPAPPAPVVTGTNAAVVTPTATGFNVDVVIPPPADPITVTGTNAAVVTSTATGFNVDVELCPANTAPVIELCPTDEFLGCGGQRYMVPAKDAAPLPVVSTVSASIDVSALSVGGGAPPAPWSVVASGNLLRGNGLYIGGTASPPNLTVTNVPAVQVGDVAIVTIQSGAVNGVAQNFIDWIDTTAGIAISDVTLIDDLIHFPFLNTSCELATRTTRFAFRFAAAGVPTIVVPAGDSAGPTPYVGVNNGVSVVVDVIRGVAPTGAIFSAIDSNEVGRPNQFTAPFQNSVTAAVDATKQSYVSFSARHIGLNSGGPAPGLPIFTGTKIQDFNPVDNFICNMWLGTGTVLGNTFDYGYNVNAGTSTATCANGGYGDVGQTTVVQFNQVTPGGNATATVPSLSNTNTNTVNCSTCAPAAQTMTEMTYYSGAVSASVPANTAYRIDYKVNGVDVGSVTLDNPSATEQVVRGGGVLFNDFSALVPCGTATQYQGSASVTLVRGTAGANITVTGNKITTKGMYA
jgi:hypothetical protein